MPLIPHPPAPAPLPPKPIISVPTTPSVPPAPVVPPKVPPPASLPPQGVSKEGYSAELRTMSADIGNIKVGQAPAGIKQTTPTTPTPGAPMTPVAPIIPSIVIPEAGSAGRGISRKMVYGITGAIAFIGITYALVSMLGGSPTPQATATPSTSSSPAPTLGGKSLRSYFPQAGPNITLKGDDTAKPDLLNAMTTSNPPSKQALRLGLTVPWPDTSAFGFLGAITGAAPAALAAAFGTDWVALSYGQQEQYDLNGALIANPTTSPRFILITEVKDVTSTSLAITAWEQSNTNTQIGQQIAPLFAVDTTKAIVDGFSSGTYRSVPVRYWNFPYADQSIDYAIVTASNNKNYLVIAGSREAAFFAIDQLMQ